MKTYFILLRRAWEFLDGARGAFIMIFVSGIIGMAAALAKPYVNGKFFNAIQLGGPDMWWNIFLFLGLLAALHFVHIILWYHSNYMGDKAQIIIKKNAMMKYYAVLYSLNMNYHVNNHSGDTLSRMRQSADGVANFAAHQATMLKHIMRFVGPLCLLVLFSWKIAVITLALSLVIIAGMTVFDLRRVAFMKQTNQTMHSFNSSLLDAVSNIKTIKIFKKREQIMNALAAKYKPMADKDIKLSQINRHKWSFFDFGSFILTNSVILLYVYMIWRSGHIILIGNVFAVQQYVKDIQDFFLGYGNEYQALLQMKTDYEEINPILNEVCPDQTCRQIRRFNDLEIQNLTFIYPGKKEPQLNNVSIRIKRGDKIAFVGESGSGKSTMLGLMAGMLGWQQGTVAINGHKSKIAALDDCTTFVPQDPEIFADSILYNITFGDDMPTDTVQDAIKMARFDEVMGRAKIKFTDWATEKGLNLSGGEKQRLALARGVLAMRGADIILLDEPTSSIDVYNENLIYDAIFKKFKSSTIISSVHKLNIIDKFDYVYVFNNGRIVESGTPGALSRAGGTFAKMMKKYKNKQ